MNRTIILRTEAIRAAAVAAVSHLPTDQDHPLEVVIRPHKATRRLEQNALYWVRLGEIAEQVWIDRRQYSADVWHEYFKREYLPEVDAQDIDLLVKDPAKWRKWSYTPAGDRICTGSTTHLTVKGFAQYLEQVYAFGALHGVRFGARE